MKDEKDIRKKRGDREASVSKSGLGTSVFMMEMIMVVFFFSLCTAICILIFVKADAMSRLAADTNQAVTKAESIAELFKAGELENYADYPETAKGISEDGSYRFEWNGSWEPAEPVSGETDTDLGDFYGTVHITREEESFGYLETAEIKIIRIRDSRELYVLNVSSYFGM